MTASAIAKDQPWLPYVAPIVAYVTLTSLEALVPAAAYPLAYAAKAVLVTIVALLFRGAWRDIRPDWRPVPLAVLVGIAAWVLWVGLDLWPGYPHLGGRQSFNPFAAIADPAERALFLLVRLYGLVILVPLIEELFWRGFLLRYASRPENFLSQPIGTFLPVAALLVGFAFAVAHPEWLAAAATAALYTLLLGRTRSLFACIVAHVTTNLVLGLYVLLSGSWHYW